MNPARTLLPTAVALAAMFALPSIARADDTPPSSAHEAPRRGAHPVRVPVEADVPEGWLLEGLDPRHTQGPPQSIHLGHETSDDVDRVRVALRVAIALELHEHGAADFRLAQRPLAFVMNDATVFDASLVDKELRLIVDAAIWPLLGESARTHLIELASAVLVVPDAVESLRWWVRQGETLTPAYTSSPSAAPDDDAEPPRPKSVLRPTQGALAGRRIALSPGHGLFWTGSAWTTQRSTSFGLLEDDLTATIAAFHLDPYLRAHGADVVWVRERDRGGASGATLDTTHPGFSLDGTFATATGWAGTPVRRASAGDASVATWELPSLSGAQPVYARWAGGADAASQVAWRVVHAGGETVVTVDARRSGSQWHYLGRYVLGPDAAVLLDARDAAGGRVEADAVRIGTSTGVLRRNGQPSGSPGWRESARYYAEFSGTPASIHQARATERDSDIVVRPLWANTLDVDAYLSVHTNAAGGTGTETFIFNGAATPGSAAFRAAVHTALVADIRAWWNPAWTDRGQKAADFGELRLLQGMPGALVEVAFHDRDPATGPDVDSLHSPRFRRIAGRALARGVARYFDPAAVFVPEPPTEITLTNGPDGLTLNWSLDSDREGASPATSWVVELSRTGRAWDAGRTVVSPPVRLEDVAPGTWVAARVRGRNAGGLGLPSTAVAARHAGGVEPGVVLVAGFTRWDRATGEEGNTFDYLIELGEALASVAPDAEGAWYFDGVTATAVGGLLPMAQLAEDAVLVWQSGEQSTVDETFSRAEQERLRSFVDAGGRLFASGSEIGWDLQARGDAADTAFLRDVLGAVYVADDAGVYEADATSEGPWAGLPRIRFDDGTGGTYDVDFPDVLDPAPGGSRVVGLRYTDGRSAAVVGPRAIVVGFPIEAVLDRSVRGALLARGLEALGAARLFVDATDPVDPVDPVDPPDAGGTSDAASPEPDVPRDGGSDDDPVPGSPDAFGDTAGGSPDGESGDERIAEDVPRRPDTGRLPDGGSFAPDGPGRRVEVNDACGCASAPPAQRNGTGLVLLALLAAFRRTRRDG